MVDVKLTVRMMSERRRDRSLRYIRVCGTRFEDEPVMLTTNDVVVEIKFI